MRDFALEVYFSKWEFKAKYHMTASDAESMPLSTLRAMASEEDKSGFDELWLGYTETRGSADLRRAIAATYETLGPDNIQSFSGAEEGIYAAMRVLLAPGDHSVIIVPNYQAAETIPLDVAAVTGVPLREHEGWRLDLQALESALRPNTKLISINFPNNPTGVVPNRETFDGLIDLCRRRDLYLFSDEVYRMLEVDETRRLPQVADIYERGLSLNVMSKAYGLPGLRIGWIASRDVDLLQRLDRYRHYLSICSAGPSERLALIALKARDRILARNRALVRQNLDTLDAFFAEFAHLFEWRRPDGGCVAFPRYLGPGGVETFCQRLVEEAGVLLLPASLYRSELSPTPADRFRIGCGRTNLGPGLEALRRFLQDGGYA